MSFEVKRNLNGAVDFSALQREHSVIVDPTDLRSLFDIGITLYSLPAYNPLADSFQLTGGEDFRVYVNEHDVTSALIEALKEKIANLDEKMVKATYLLGAKRYIDFAAAFLPNEVKNDLNFAREYAELGKWTEKFAKLGDRKVGWSGNLHPLSYIYRWIPIDPLALSDVWRRYRANDASLPAQLRDFRILRITFSCGPAPSFAAIDPGNFLPSGRLVYSLELAYDNPLAPAIQQILSRIRALQTEVESLRLNYLDPLTGDVQTLRKDFDGNYKALSDAVRVIQESVNKIG